MIRAARLRLLAVCLVLAGAGAARGADIRCSIDNGAVVVAAAYGPIAGDFLLDLSQAHSQLHATAAQTAGWTDDHTSRTLRLAGQTLRDFPMSVADLGARTAAFPTNISGVLGADAMRRFALDLTFTPCRLRLTRGLPPKRPGVHVLNVRTLGGVPVVSAAISDGVTARAGLFAIDTASAGSRIADAGFSRALPAGADPADRARPPARLRAVSVGGVLVEQTPAGVMGPAAPGLSGALGLGVWETVGPIQMSAVGRRGGGRAKPRRLAASG